MKVENKYPPNIEDIKRSFPITPETIFAYGDIIYAPHHEHIPPDVIAHEEVHQRQQKFFTSPDVWWNKYLLDKDFRLLQEVEAYATQYQWVKERSNTRVANEAVIEMAHSLSSPLYGLNLTYNQAEKMIKKYAIQKE